MTRRRKLVFGAAGAFVVLLLTVVAVKRNSGQSLPVQVGEVTRQTLSSVVTASGEIRPKHYVNITSQTFGKIVSIDVTEGDQVKVGQVLLRMEATQPASGVAAQRAIVKSAEAAKTATEASQRTAEAELERAKADRDRAKLDWDRGQQLFQQGVIAASERDMRKATYESAQAAVTAAEARVRQAVAELERSESQQQEARAGLTRSEDDLNKTVYQSPIDGVVTSLPVHVGEQMVPGIQNSPGSYLMTVADMSGVTAEIRVDESDVLEVKPGQPAEVTVDAYPDSVFHGSVTEIGTTALLRSTGQSTSQLTTGSQEAKDFKVEITLAQAPAGVRPGLSATAKITTANHEKVLSIPLQALTMRRQSDIDKAEKLAHKGKGGRKADSKGGTGDAKAAEGKAGSGDAKAGASDGKASAGESDTKPAQAAAAASDPASKKEVQGVFVVEGGRARFHPVKTGITGVTEIEVLDGVKEGDKIVTGSFKVLRELKHLTKVRQVKSEENKPST